jgi:hypothetical protein
MHAIVTADDDARNERVSISRCWKAGSPALSAGKPIFHVQPIPAVYSDRARASHALARVERVAPEDCL